MSTASITHGPHPHDDDGDRRRHALGFAGLTVLHDDTSPPPVRHSTNVDDFSQACRQAPSICPPWSHGPEHPHVILLR